MLIPGTLPVGLPLSTGVLVLYADDESFTLMTPQGHTFAGWITFSSYEEDGYAVAQAQVLLRAYDPIYEIGFRFFGAGKTKDTFWTPTLPSLAAHFIVDSPPEAQRTFVGPKIHWAGAKKVWPNSAIRTALDKMTFTVRWSGRGFLD